MWNKQDFQLAEELYSWMDSDAGKWYFHKYDVRIDASSKYILNRVYFTVTHSGINPIKISFLSMRDAINYIENEETWA